MARYDVTSAEMAPLAGSAQTPELFYELGIQSSIRRDGGVDLIAAHKWFNIAAAKGFPDAVRMRGEVAAEMSVAEIAEAQRAARTFLSLH
jgi:TPR repeat protein